jgi:hypothetical protein
VQKEEQRATLAGWCVSLVSIEMQKASATSAKPAQAAIVSHQTKPNQITSESSNDQGKTNTESQLDSRSGLCQPNKSLGVGASASHCHVRARDCLQEFIWRDHISLRGATK